MRTQICVIAAALAVFGGTTEAFADAEPGQGYFTFMGSYIDDDKDRGIEDAINGGQFGIGYALNERWNVEGMLSAAIPKTKDPAFGPDQDHLGLGIDLQRMFRRDERFTPYLHAGVGYFQVDPTGPNPDEEGAMYSVGAGFLLDLFDSNVAVRGEWRHRLDSASQTNFRDNLISVGLHIPFGPATRKVSDTDGDGVEDSLDRCPGTPAGAAVDTYGCELDSDGDGVKDSLDKCPNTPRGVSVNADGCPNDSDGDGVTDDLDKCPGTPAGAAVDADGCELDSDGDGVVDRLDECPGTTAGVQVDAKGCEIKEEIELRGVNFESNSDRLLPGATSVLDYAVATLKRNPTIEVEVAGHTDSDGAADYNESLSERRATTVRDYLQSNGISGDRMTVRGYGESEPVADNNSATGKAQNRRVVLRITER